MKCISWTLCLCTSSKRAHADFSKLRSARVGDARALPFDSITADVVLLLEPLYHFVERRDRLAALSEARRVLRPDGLLPAASCNRFVTVLQGVFRDMNSDTAFAEMAMRDLETGQHRSPQGRDYFTTAYFHMPEELAAELRDAGLKIDAVLAVEGPGWLLPDFDDAWSDERRRAELIQLAKVTAAEPSLLGASTHVLVVARAGDAG